MLSVERFVERAPSAPRALCAFRADSLAVRAGRALVAAKRSTLNPLVRSSDSQMPGSHYRARESLDPFKATATEGINPVLVAQDISRPGRKSHSKSQRGQPSGDTQLRQATVEAGQVPSEPSPATSSDAQEVTGGQGVAGSNPAVPTGSDVFSNILPLTRAGKRAISWRNGPSRGARRSCATASYQGICQDGRARKAGQSRGQTSLSRPGTARRPRQLRTGGHHPPPTG